MKFPFYARLALTLVAIVLTVFILSFANSIFIPLVFALLLSALFYPVCRWLEQRFKFPRFLAAIFCTLLSVAVVASFVYFITLHIISFAQDLPHLEEHLEQMLTKLQYWIATEYNIDSKQQIDYLNKAADSSFATAANSIGNIFISLSTFTIWSIFVFIYTFFMLSHRRLLLQFVLALFKPEYKPEVNEVVQETRGMVNGYVVGLLIEMVIVSILNTAVLAILGIKYALLLGIIAGVLNVIPYLGIYTATAFGMLVTFANSSITDAISLAIAFIVIHFVDANILMPRIVGSRVKMNPLITIIAVLTGHLIWGIPGMFLFIPIAGIIKIISHRVEDLKAWAILMGVEEKEKSPKPKKIKME